MPRQAPSSSGESGSEDAVAVAVVGIVAGAIIWHMTEIAGLRTALLDLHRELLESQRVQAERISGRMSAGEVLQAAADDLRFDWLRTVSQLISELDEAAGSDEPERVTAVVARARE